MTFDVLYTSNVTSVQGRAGGPGSPSQTVPAIAACISESRGAQAVSGRPGGLASGRDRVSRRSGPRIGDNRPISSLDHIRSYYEALNTGDPELVASHFTDDATHYYTRLGPHEGASAIGENTKWAVENLEGQWWIEHGIDSGDEAVIEWTMTWRDPKSGEKRLNRGTEWFRLRGGKIAEVRAYHHGDRKNPEGNLLGFDHGARGHTTIEDWAPAAGHRG